MSNNDQAKPPDLGASTEALKMGGKTPEPGDLGLSESSATSFLNRVEVTTLATDTILQSRYQIEKVIGVGGMGAVYLVRDLRFRGAIRSAALKEIIVKFSDPADQALRMQNFEREANLLGSLSHPAIPHVSDFFTEFGRSYLVMEYIEGLDLEEVMNRTLDFISERDAINWAIQICDVLDYLHSHKPNPIIFRDLKPSNVMKTSSNQIKLIDFGIAKAFQNTKKGTMIGTEGYSPPEQYRGMAEPRSDLYALGAMMHHLLTKNDPRMETPFTFNERLPRAINPNVSVELEAIVMRLLDYEMEKRFASAAEVKQALLQVIGSTSPFISTGQFKRLPGSSPLSPTVVESRPVGSSEALSHTALSLGQQAQPKLIWRFSTEEEVRSTPTVAKGLLYVGSYDNNLYALNAKTGEFVWKFATQDGICSSPAVQDDVVYFGSEDQQVYAVDARTGQERWVFRTQGKVRSSPFLNGDNLYIGSDDGYLYAIDVRNGKANWKFRTWRQIRGTPYATDDLVFVGSEDEYFYAVDAINGVQKWRAQLGNRVTASSPALADDLIMFGSYDTYLHALDYKMGWIAWKFKTGNFIISAPAVADGKVYFGSVDKNLYCVEIKTGRSLWKFTAGDQVNSRPAIDGRAVYFGCVDSFLYSVSLKSGKLNWKYKTGDQVVSSPHLVEDMLYIGSNDHTIYAFQLPA